MFHGQDNATNPGTTNDSAGASRSVEDGPETPSKRPAPGDIIDARTLMETILQVTPYEVVATLSKAPRTGAVKAQCYNLNGVTKVVGERFGGDMWFGVNPRRPGIPYGLTGDVDTITRLAAGFADLDVKPKSCRDIAHAEEIITAIGEAIGTPAAVVTYTGHGLHPLWPIRVGGFTAEFTREQGAVLLRRFGALVVKVAAEHGAAVDTVWDLPRLLRMPGTTNCKDASNPVETFCRYDGDHAITVAELTAKLDELGIADPDQGHRPAGRLPQSSPGVWGYAAETCSYAQTAIDAWGSDIVEVELAGSERHDWAGGQATRIACMHRYGCLSAEGHAEAERALEAALTSRRDLSDAGEMERWLQWGIDKAAEKDDGEVARELGGHTHGTGLQGLTSGLLDTMVAEARAVAAAAPTPPASAQAACAMLGCSNAPEMSVGRGLDGKHSLFDVCAAHVEHIRTTMPEAPMRALGEELEGRTSIEPGTYHIAPTIGAWPEPTLPRVEDVGWIKTAADAAAAGWATPVVRRKRSKGGGIDTSFDPFDRAAFPLGHPAAPDLLRLMFGYNEVTRAILHRARARNPKPTGPFALLSTELTRVGVRANPEFQLTRGTSLSTIYLRGARSGKGKSLATAPTKFLPIVMPTTTTTTTTSSNTPAGGAVGVLPERNWDANGAVATGEKLADRLFKEEHIPDPRREGKTIVIKRQIDHCSTWVENDEFGATLRKGATESSILFMCYNAGWSGKPFSFDTRTHGEMVFDKLFNIFITGGIQPELWGELARQITGFIQRVAFVGVSDPWRLPDAAGRIEHICDPVPAEWQPPRMPEMPDGGVFTLCDEMIADIGDDDTSAVEVSDDDDEWETHHMQARAKTAGQLALRCGTTVICPDIWRLSGFFMEHHHRQLAHMQAQGELAESARREGLGEERADIDLAKTTRQGVHQIEGVTLVLDLLAKAGGEMTLAELLRKAGPRRSGVAKLAVTSLSQPRVGKVEVTPGNRRDSFIVRLVPERPAAAAGVAPPAPVPPAPAA